MEENSGHNKNEVMCMFRGGRAIKKFSSVMQSVRKRISFKKLLLLGFLAVLFTANGAFWYLRLLNSPPPEPEGHTEPKEWEISLNEEKIPETKLEENNVVQESVTEEDDLKNNTDEKGLSEKDEVVQVFAQNPATMVMPVVGKIITDHSSNGLVYSKTLEQWCAHKGVDIAADVGTQVKAAMAGTVVEVRNSDARLGVVVVIDHGNGLKTLYGNLMADNLVHKGKRVKKGEVIGGVGKTAPFEIEDPPHLHFEVLRGNESVDPKNFLPNL
jgi:murein DD-endopeptidase MepM/ murein hydrolase activator NlpD